MKDNQYDGNSSLLYSLLLSMQSGDDYDITLEDKRYLLNQGVSECKVKIYQLVVVMLSEGKSYDEIISVIDKIDIEEYKRLNEEEKDYIQRIFRKDLNSRKRKLDL